MNKSDFFLLFSNIYRIWWITVNLSNKKEWIVFPWENKENEVKEIKEYSNKRDLK